MATKSFQIYQILINNQSIPFTKAPEITPGGIQYKSYSYMNGSSVGVGYMADLSKLPTSIKLYLPPERYYLKLIRSWIGNVNENKTNTLILKYMGDEEPRAFYSLIILKEPTQSPEANEWEVECEGLEREHKNI